MLIINRYRNETIDIGDDITITVAEIRGDKVRLGIEAPPHVIVNRREVTRQIEGDGCDAIRGPKGCQKHFDQQKAERDALAEQHRRETLRKDEA